MIHARGGRILERELLDDAPDGEAHQNLRQLAWLNRWFGGHRVLRHSLSQLYTPQDAFTLLDVGAASGDHAGAIHRRFPHARVTCLDWKLRNLRQAPPPRVQADAFALPFSPAAFDVVHCALFLHHFTNPQIVQLLRNMAHCARRAVVVQDLERHPLAYYFLPATQWLFGWNRLMVHDGAISVEAAFHPSELAALATQAGLTPEVRRHLPWFRLSLIAEPR